MNKKEWIKALVSAISATANKDVVLQRYRKINGLKSLPLVIDDKIEGLTKAKDIMNVLRALGLENETEKGKKVRAGKGKARGRRYKKRKGLLLVINEDRGIMKAGRNIPGLDVVTWKDIKVNLLAPGAQPGRLTIWTRSAASAAEKLGG